MATRFFSLLGANVRANCSPHAGVDLWPCPWAAAWVRQSTLLRQRACPSVQGAGVGAHRALCTLLFRCWVQVWEHGAPTSSARECVQGEGRGWAPGVEQSAALLRARDLACPPPPPHGGLTGHGCFSPRGQRSLWRCRFGVWERAARFACWSCWTVATRCFRCWCGCGKQLPPPPPPAGAPLYACASVALPVSNGLGAGAHLTVRACVLVRWVWACEPAVHSVPWTRGPVTTTCC